MYEKVHQKTWYKYLLPIKSDRLAPTKRNKIISPISTALSSSVLLAQNQQQQQEPPPSESIESLPDHPLITSSPEKGHVAVFSLSSSSSSSLSSSLSSLSSMAATARITEQNSENGVGTNRPTSANCIKRFNYCYDVSDDKSAANNCSSLPLASFTSSSNTSSSSSSSSDKQSGQSYSQQQRRTPNCYQQYKQANTPYEYQLTSPVKLQTNGTQTISTNTNNNQQQSLPLNRYYPTRTQTSANNNDSKNSNTTTNNNNIYKPISTEYSIEQNLFNIVRFDIVKNNFSDYYKLGDFVRSGGFSEVHEGVRLSDNRNVVIKFIPKEKTKNWLSISNKKYPAEILLHKCVHEIQGVIHIHDYFESPEFWILVMDRLRHCQDLFDYLEARHRGRLSEADARKFFIQLVHINLAMIRKGVVHRDLKSENILVDLDTDSLVLIDFGASAIYKGLSFYSDFHGTRQYKTPEYILKKRYSAVPSTVWTLGILLYDMVTGRLPFENEEEITRYKLILKPFLSADLKNIIVQCLQLNPDRRPSFESLLEHPWIKNGIGTSN
ncbi:unnamed protein product [Didymodactylos carnosus]|uniref:Serine/threonine-protein kinase 1 n=1 Tax=Didymodactylos carnosus TaxID=1234261 RepID=A0A814AA52_9BILA|nr:unnamed protein product [Didymodactylos carnosus]CAF1276701.1 unnamed protein product [Didymodactylos carnosus]CAF3692763.1 unnamed protein product [Didymodactylos carnosus]CAF4081775.1 unnamed protein product [Didymodactylos carnosus]